MMQDQPGMRQQADTRSPWAKASEDSNDLADRMGQTTLSREMEALLRELDFVKSQRAEAQPLLRKDAAMLGQLEGALTDANAEIARLKSESTIVAVATEIASSSSAPSDPVPMNGRSKREA